MSFIRGFLKSAEVIKNKNPKPKAPPKKDLNVGATGEGAWIQNPTEM